MDNRNNLMRQVLKFQGGHRPDQLRELLVASSGMYNYKVKMQPEQFKLWYGKHNIGSNLN